MQALAGYKRVRTYDTPGDPAISESACEPEPSPAKEKGEAEKKTKAKKRSAAPKVASEELARNENNVILSVSYHPEQNEDVSLVVKNFTTHADLIRKLQKSDLAWIVDLWRKKMG